jgi:Flp pilus assembly protein TadD
VDSARLIATEATARFPDQAGAHAVLGRVLLAGEHYAEAEEAFFEALRLEPSFASARRLLGTAQAASGRFDEAIASWQRWRQLAERSPEEMKLQEGVDRLQAAARLLSDAIKGWYD